MSKQVIEQLALFDLGEEEKVDDKYSIKNLVPQYTPTSQTQPPLYALVDKIKTNQLIGEIMRSNVSQQEKEFLILAAYRHLVFNYSEIAEYYCHATPEMQKLMEKSALVIIDVKDAIANGYVKLSENIKNIMIKTGREAKEEYHNQARDTRKQL